MRFISHETLDSTNLEAKRLAEQGDFGPLWIRADKQSAGRGRRGREWTSDTGNLFCSGLYPHEGTLQQAAQLSFVAAIAVHEMLGEYLEEDFLSLKWPNDVLYKGKKIAGILLENGSFHNHNYVIIGIGVNLVSHPENTLNGATHLLENLLPKDLNCAEPIFTGPEPILAKLAADFDTVRGFFTRDGFAIIREDWEHRSAGIPGPVTVRLPNETFTGEALGLDANGALRVSLTDGTIRDVHAGDVFFGS